MNYSPPFFKIFVSILLIKVIFIFRSITVDFHELNRKTEISEMRRQTFARQPPNGLRYLRWGGDGEAVQLEKCSGVENCLRFAQTPQRQVHALLARS